MKRKHPSTNKKKRYIPSILKKLGMSSVEDGKKNKLSKKQRNKIILLDKPSIMEILEPRMMYDATVADAAMDAQASPDVDQASQDAIQQDQQVDKVHEKTKIFDEKENVERSSAERKEIVFVDKSVEDYETLLSKISRDVEIVFIEEGEDGLQKMSDILKSRSDIDAIHLITHGTAGELQLGNVALNMDTMGQHLEQLETIKQSLSDTGDILLYGCNVAETKEGVDFIQDLSMILSADIAASDDVTGNEIFGGDWDLEYEMHEEGGDIETDIIFTGAIDEYKYALYSFEEFTEDVVVYLAGYIDQLMSQDFKSAAGLLNLLLLPSDFAGVVEDFAYYFAVNRALELVDEHDSRVDLYRELYFGQKDGLELPNIPFAVEATDEFPELPTYVEGEETIAFARNINIIPVYNPYVISRTPAGEPIIAFRQQATIDIAITEGTDGDRLSFIDRELGDQGLQFFPNMDGANHIAHTVEEVEYNDGDPNTMALLFRDINGNPIESAPLVKLTYNDDHSRVSIEYQDKVPYHRQTIDSNQVLTQIVRSIGFSSSSDIDHTTQSKIEITVTRPSDDRSGTMELGVKQVPFTQLPGQVVLTDTQDIPESAATGFVVGHVSLQMDDPNAPAPETVHYKLQNNPDNMFDITRDGEIFLKNNNLDFEKQTSYTVNVLAFDGENSTETELVIHVTDANDAPILDTTKPIFLSPTIANSIDNPGDLVEKMVLATSDQEGAILGVAITGVDNTNGTWQFNVTGEWETIHKVSDASALLLAPDAKLRFTPNPGYEGESGAIQYRAWDQTQGTSGNLANLGEITAYSMGSEQVETTSTTVYKVNDYVAGTDGVPIVDRLNLDTSSTDVTLSVSLDAFDENSGDKLLLENYQQGDPIFIFKTERVSTGFGFTDVTHKIQVGEVTHSSDDRIEFKFLSSAMQQHTNDVEKIVSSVKFENALDTAAPGMREITYQLRDTNNTIDYGTTTYFLEVVDPSVPPESAISNNTIAENAANDAIVGQISVSNLPNKGDYTYTLVGENGPFKIDPITGVIRVADTTKIDFEKASSHMINVSLVNDDNNVVALAPIEIVVIDTDESFKIGSNTVKEHAPVGTVVADFIGITEANDTLRIELVDQINGTF